MTDATIPRSPSVQIERQVQARHGYVADSFSGYASSIAVNGTSLTIDAQDVNGVRFVVTVDGAGPEQPADTLAAKIARAIDLKQGDKDFALFFSCDFWEAHLGNSSGCVMLGEVSGDFIGGGATPEAAVDRLLEKLQEQG